MCCHCMFLVASRGRKRKRAIDPYFYTEIAEDDKNYNEWYKGANVGDHNIIKEAKRNRKYGNEVYVPPEVHVRGIYSKQVYTGYYLLYS